MSPFFTVTLITLAFLAAAWLASSWLLRRREQRSFAMIDSEGVDAELSQDAS
ncbi:hypothetical protein N0B51_08825 [Tsuneonella sp. YG55]|uniref:Cbb3-type cytochrome oxidase component FixQ n=1 Tax=Tsuneonella litorea TaxID=2976475 RepID=A0A9X3ALC0_9SPHN|nr:hypothetical protein [Tsuneonella litorea]MCT2559083.1 hypothetical protein [Tsuneonella litorea]